MLRRFCRWSSLVAKQATESIPESELNALYDALHSPVAMPAVGPQGTKLKKLDADYLKKLQITYQDLTLKTQAELSQRTASLSTSLEKPTLMNLTELIHVNAMTHRVNEAQLAFDQMKDLGIQPD